MDLNKQSQLEGGAFHAATLADPDTHLHGRMLVFLRVLWGLLATGLLLYLIYNLIMLFALYHKPCTDPTRASCSSSLQLTPVQISALSHYSISLNEYAVYAFVCILVTALVFVSLGVLIFWLRSDERIALFTSLWLILFGSHGLDSAPLPFSFNLSAMLGFLEWGGMFLLFALFPNGRFVPRWSWILVILFAGTALIALFIPEFSEPFFFVVPFLFIGIVISQLYRYHVISTILERQQIKCFATGFAVTVIFLVIIVFLPRMFIPALYKPGSWFQLAFPVLYSVEFLPIPLGIGIALLRYRLWDIDVLINRTLVYGSLTAILLGVYLLLVFTGQNLLVGVLRHSDPVILVVSTLMVAALFQPLRHRLQQLIDRRFYRQKYDAARVLSALSATLQQEIELEQLSERLVTVVAETMQPAHISLWLCKPQTKQQDVQAT